MSKLLGEDDEWLYLIGYLHGSGDEWPSWLCSEDGKQCPDPKWPEYILEAEHYALYEVAVEYCINKKTGAVEIVKADL